MDPLVQKLKLDPKEMNALDESVMSFNESDFASLKKLAVSSKDKEEFSANDSIRFDSKLVLKKSNNSKDCKSTPNIKSDFSPSKRNDYRMPYSIKNKQFEEEKFPNSSNHIIQCSSLSSSSEEEEFYLKNIQNNPD